MLTSQPLASSPAVTTTKSACQLLGEIASSATPNPVADADIEDMALLTRGDTAALGRLYARYARATFAAAYSLLQDPASAEDAVQDTFMRAWRNASSFQPRRGSVRSWLVSIARHSAIDQLRSRSVAQRRQPVLARLELPVAFEDPAIMSDLIADAHKLHSLLDALPHEQRQAIELAFFSGLTHEEIASRTGAPLGTVKGRVRLGLRRLRDTFDDSRVALSVSVRQHNVVEPVHPNQQ